MDTTLLLFLILPLILKHSILLRKMIIPPLFKLKLPMVGEKKEGRKEGNGGGAVKEKRKRK